MIGQLAAGDFAPALGDSCNRSRDVPPSLDKEPRHGLAQEFGIASVTSSATTTTASAALHRRGNALLASRVSGLRKSGASEIDARERTHGGGALVGLVGRVDGLIGPELVTWPAT
jgi:hypothetical protein